MANKDLDVCNLAILQAGGERLDSFDDQTPLAEYCKTNYPQARDWALGIYRWTFATGIVQLAQLANPPVAPRNFVYAPPSDLVGAIHAFRQTARIDGCTVHDHITFQGGIASDCSPLYAEYTRQVSEDQWPSHFVEFFVKLFAAGIAQAKGNASLAQAVYQRAVGAQFTSQGLPGGLLLAAQEADARNSPERNLAGWEPGELVTARWWPMLSPMLIFTTPPTIWTFETGNPTPTQDVIGVNPAV